MNIPDSVNPQDPRAPWNTQTVKFEARINFSLGDFHCQTYLKDTVDISNYDLLGSKERRECCVQQAEEVFQRHLDSEGIEDAHLLWADILSWEKE